MYQGHRIGVVVPAFNEERLLWQTVENIPDFVDRIYVVDDASTDATPAIIASLLGSRVVGIRHETNRGVGGAIVSGYKKALGEGMEVVAVMAGDNQMDPTQLPHLLEPVIAGKADYAKGNRLSNPLYRRGITKWRLFGNWLLTWLTKIATGNWKLLDPQNGYTAISRKALLGIELDKVYPYYGYCNDLLVKLTVHRFKIMDKSMPLHYGGERSKIRYRKYIVKVSLLLLRDFLWRLWRQYIVKPRKGYYETAPR